MTITTPALPLAVNAATWPLPPWNLVTPTTFRLLNSVTTVPTVKSGLHWRAITELFKDAGAPLTNLFFTVVVKDMSFGPSQGGWVGLKQQINSNVPISLSLWILSSTLNQFAHCESPFFFFFIATLFPYLFIFGCVGSSVRARAFSSCGKRGPLFIAVRGPLFIAVRGPPTTAASPAAEHRLQTRRPSNCGSPAQPLRGMWDSPRPGLEPVSPAPAGGLPTTAPPGKPCESPFDPCFSQPNRVLSNYASCNIKCRNST